MLRLLRQSVVILLLMTVITGVVYPLVVTGIAQLVFPGQANGSLINKDGKAVGSKLIGQSFSDPRYFWPRPSATLDANGKPLPYNGGNSGGSNLGPLNPQLQENVRKQVAALRSADPSAKTLASHGEAERSRAPVDLVTASGSGLDPDISIAAAEYQVPRVAKARHMPEQRVRDLLNAHVSPRQLGILGEPRVNVLELNLALDKIK